MTKKRKKRYQPHEFAKHSGVTVRTLHHYDRIGLLKPGDYSRVGFRLYRDGDFARLQQIVTLKFIGFSLREIKRLLDGKGSGLPAALRAQRITLQEKRRYLDSAIDAIAKAETIAATSSKPGWEMFQKITEAIQMQNNTDWTKQYYNDEAQKVIDQRKPLWNPELQKKMEADWAALYKDIESAAADEIDPSSPRAQSLADRQDQLVGAFTGGNAAVEEGLGKLWADQSNWPEEFKKQMFDTFAKQGVPAAKTPAPKLLSAEAEAFMKKVTKAQRH